MTDTIEERAREIACSAFSKFDHCQHGHSMDCDRVASVITAALRAEHERGQRDMRERLTAVAVEQCGGGFHDRKRLRSAIAALPITPDSEKEATTAEDYDRDYPWHEDSDMGAR